MWVVEACFEGSEDPYKKLLKPGKRYTLGRKPPAELILQNKSVSQDAGHIDVGPWQAPPLIQASSSTQSGIHPSAQSPSLAITRRPYVRVHAGKKMVRIIGSKDVETWEKDKANFVGSQVLPESDSEVGDGDVIILTMTSPPVTLKWIPLAFCIAAKKNSTESDVQDRARELSFLSIPLVLSSNMTAGCTHLVTTSVTPTVPLFGALTALARIVAMTFVDETIRRGNLNREQADSWEQRFELPDESSFFPTEGSVEGMSLEELKKVYYPNPARSKLLEGMKFLVATSSERMIKAIDRSEHVYEAAGASVERCPVPTLESHQDGRKALRFLEAKKAGHEGLFIILSSTFEDAEQPWYGAFAAASKRLKIPMPEGGVFALNKALLYVTTEDFLDQMTNVQVDAPAEDQEQSSEQKEKPATPPPASITTTQAVTPSRRLKRRAGMERVDPLAELFGTSNPNTSTANASAQPEQRALEEATSESTQRRRRNLGEGAKAPRRSELWRELLGPEHSAGHAPKATPVSSFSGSGDTERYTKRFRMELDEAEQKATQRKRDVETGQQERREHEQADEDSKDIADGSQDAQDTDSAKLPEESKHNGRQRLGRTEVSDVSPPELEASGAYVQETPASTQSGVTTDQKFLQSVASMKRNAKKRMNDFDREFDQLRLSKPSAGSRTRGTMKISSNVNEDEDEEYRAWNEMDEDDFNISAAGNFVQVDFVPLLRPRPEVNGEVSMSNGNEESLTARHRPNFKKFKNKERPKRRPLQLDLPEFTDFGISTTYGAANKAKHNKSREERQSSVFATDGQDGEEPEDSRSGSLATQRGSMRQTQLKSIFNSIRVGDDDHEEDVPPPPQSTAGTRQASVTRHNASQRTQNTRSQSIEDSTQGSRHAIDLRLDIDDDNDDNDDSFLQSSKQKRDKGKEKASSSSSSWTKPSNTAAQAPKGSSQRLVPSKRSARSRAAESDSSSDEGFSFKGFKRAR